MSATEESLKIATSEVLPLLVESDSYQFEDVESKLMSELEGDF